MKNIEDRLLNIEAIAITLLKEAAMLRKELPVDGQPVAPRKGYSREVENEVKIRREKKQLRKQFIK